MADELSERAKGVHIIIAEVVDHYEGAQAIACVVIEKAGDCRTRSAFAERNRFKPIAGVARSRDREISSGRRVTVVQIDGGGGKLLAAKRRQSLRPRVRQACAAYYRDTSGCRS